MFERLKELEDAEYSNLAESDKTGNRKRRGDPVPLPPHGNDKNDNSTTSNNVFNKNKANQFQKCRFTKIITGMPSTYNI